MREFSLKPDEFAAWRAEYEGTIRQYHTMSTRGEKTDGITTPPEYVRIMIAATASDRSSSCPIYVITTETSVEFEEKLSQHCKAVLADVPPAGKVNRSQLIMSDGDHYALIDFKIEPDGKKQCLLFDSTGMLTAEIGDLLEEAGFHPYIAEKGSKRGPVIITQVQRANYGCAQFCVNSGAALSNIDPYDAFTTRKITRADQNYSTLPYQELPPQMLVDIQAGGDTIAKYCGKLQGDEIRLQAEGKSLPPGYMTKAKFEESLHMIPRGESGVMQNRSSADTSERYFTAIDNWVNSHTEHDILAVGQGEPYQPKYPKCTPAQTRAEWQATHAAAVASTKADDDNPVEETTLGIENGPR